MSREIHKKRLEILEIQKKNLQEEMALKRQKHQNEMEFSRKKAKKKKTKKDCKIYLKRL